MFRIGSNVIQTVECYFESVDNFHWILERRTFVGNIEMGISINCSENYLIDCEFHAQCLAKCICKRQYNGQHVCNGA